MFPKFRLGVEKSPSVYREEMSPTARGRAVCGAGERLRGTAAEAQMALGFAASPGVCGGAGTVPGRVAAGAPATARAVGDVASSRAGLAWRRGGVWQEGSGGAHRACGRRGRRGSGLAAPPARQRLIKPSLSNCLLIKVLWSTIRSVHCLILLTNMFCSPIKRGLHLSCQSYSAGVF